MHHAKRALGFVPTREFTKTRQHRKNARSILSLQTDQRLEKSPWDSMESISTKVDVERANEKGLLYSQPAPDPTPRLVKPQGYNPPPKFNPVIDPKKVMEWLKS